MTFILVVGNPGDGLRFVGPFSERGDANDWADEHVTREYDWWVCKLNTPTEGL